MTEQADTGRTRQGLYRYFGGALLPPNPVRLASIAAAGDYLDGTGLEQFPYYGSWSAFAAAAEDAAAEDLATEYVALFASGADGSLCPPTESYYRGNAEGGKIARIVAQVEQAYGDMGLSLTNRSEAPDHAATELEAMSVLCAREAEARESGSFEATTAALAKEDRFLRGHLAIWFPAFRGRVAEAPRARRYYSTLIDAVHAFIVHDVDFVDLLIRQLKGAAA